MIRNVLFALTLLVLLHVVAAGGFVGWLWQSDRLSKERVDATVELFKPTLTEDAARDQQAASLLEQAEEAAEQAAYLDRVASGPVATADRLAQQETKEEMQSHRYARLEAEAADLRRQMTRVREQVDAERAELEDDRLAFEQYKQEMLEKQQTEDFKKTVGFYEQLPAKQAKAMFEGLLAQGQVEQVVTYLAAMQPRKAAGVLKEFKSPEEAAVAGRLLEGLRQRGIDPLSP